MKLTLYDIHFFMHIDSYKNKRLRFPSLNGFMYIVSYKNKKLRFPSLNDSPCINNVYGLAHRHQCAQSICCLEIQGHALDMWVCFQFETLVLTQKSKPFT